MGGYQKQNIFYFRLGGEFHKPVRIGNVEEANYKCMYEFVLRLVSPEQLGCSSTTSAELKQQGHRHISNEAPSPQVHWKSHSLSMKVGRSDVYREALETLAVKPFSVFPLS